jgi:hypothetical protein
MFQGGWSFPAGIHPVKAYFWIAAGSYSFMLEAFVFISGYTFCYQLYKQKKYTIQSLLSSKFKRLIIPSIVFSVAYFFLFMNDKPFDIWVLFNTIINGAGHMWFLPMLFWCFIATYFIERIKINEKYLLILLFVIACIPFSFLPLRLSSTCYYLFFFYFGLVMFKHKSYCVRYSKPIILYWWGVFVFLFVALTLLKQYLNHLDGRGIMNILYSLIERLSTLLYSTFGLVIFYLSTIYFVEIRNVNIHKKIIDFNKLCFGIYLYQQFVLIILYYKTSFPEILGSYWLPIVGFIVSLFLSVVLAYCTRIFKVGRFLIG